MMHNRGDNEFTVLSTELALNETQILASTLSLTNTYATVRIHCNGENRMLHVG